MSLNLLKNQSQILFHVDCDNFYTSCETAFNPSIRNKPIVVLSNNMGCIASLNKIAKSLGYKVGDVYFKIKKEYEFHGGVALLPNYTLYGELSSQFKYLLIGR